MTDPSSEDTLDDDIAAASALLSGYAPPAPPPQAPVFAGPQILNVAANGMQVIGQESGDTINDATFSNNTIYSYQGGDSHTTINLGTGTNNTVTAHTYDTVNAGLGTQTIQEYQGHDNTFLLGDGNFNVSLSQNDTLTAGNGTDVVQMYTAATNDVISLGSGNDSVSMPTNSGLSAGDGNDTVFGAVNDVIALGKGNNNVTLAANDTLTVGNGTNSVLFYTGATNDVINLGNGADNVNAGTHNGNFTVNAGTGADIFGFYSMTGGNLTIIQAGGGAPSIFDVNSSTLTSFTATIANATDVIVDFGSTIGKETVNVAVDGYKAPYGATVNYVATNEAIAAPYNIAQPLPYFMAGILFDPAPHWTSSTGTQATPLTLTYSFMQSLPSYASAADAKGFVTLGGDLPAGYTPQQLLTANANHTIAALSAAEVSAITALANWALVLNINFVSAADSNAVQIRFGENSQGVSGGAGYSYTPVVPVSPYYPASSYLESGDIYLNKDVVTPTYFNTDGYGGHVFAHEVGHAIGQGGESGAADPNDVLPNGEDNGANTVQSYNGPYMNMPGPFDIATSQYLYGPNPNYHPNPSHVWTFSASGGAGNLISDGGGSPNTISAAGTTQTAYIDLRPGHWDYLGSQAASILAPNQLMIDYGTVVNNAVAGSGATTLVCNDNADTIACGAGTDFVVVGPGNSSIAGGSGIDTVLFSSTAANYAIAANSDGSVTVTGNGASGQGADRIANIEYLQFADKVAFVVNADQANIARLYSAALNRAPDPGGLSAWEAIYANNISASVKAQGPYASLAETSGGYGGSLSIAAGFTNSVEFQNNYGSLTNSQFINLMYENVLGRPAAPSETAAWLTWMTTGDSTGQIYTKEMVLVGFAESPENVAKTGGDWLFQV